MTTDEATKATIDRFNETFNRHDVDVFRVRDGKVAEKLSYAKG